MPADSHKVERPASQRRLTPLGTLLVILLTAALSSACVYRMDVQQGNRLDDATVDQVQVGMTRSQVQFLLGTPMVADPFRTERWDYPYYFKRGRERRLTQRWVVVHFEGDRVVRIERRTPGQS